MTRPPSSTSLPRFHAPQTNPPIYDLLPHTSAPTFLVCHLFPESARLLTRAWPVFAWCIQYIQQQPPPATLNDKSRKSPSPGKIRVTCFWQHDLKSLWNLATTAGLAQQLSTMMIGLLKTVFKRGTHVAKLTGYGNGVSIERIQFQVDREALTIDYAVVPEDDEHPQMHGMDEVHALREQQRLIRSIECVLPSSEGWDVRVTTKASSEEVQQLAWTTRAIRCSSSCSSATSDQIMFRVSHAALIDENSVLKVKVVIERSGPSSGLRLNGIPQTIHQVEERDPSSSLIPEQILQDVSSAVDLSSHTSSSLGTVHSRTSASSIPASGPPTIERTVAADKSILSKVRRNYIYFSSLLQEPEAKWRRSMLSTFSLCVPLQSVDALLQPRKLGECQSHN